MFELVWPYMLLFIPLPLLIYFFAPRAKLQLPQALRLPFYNALAPVIVKPQEISYKALTFILGLIWIFIVFALSGPRWVGTPIPITREGYNIMLALDISGSMEVPDMSFHGRPVSRLSVVKRAAVKFVEDRVGDKIGLILFGTRAYLQTPLTYDRKNVLTRIEDAEAGLAGKSTSIGDALGLAIKRLQDVPPKGRVVILLTDGVSNSGVLTPMKAAKIAKEDGIKVYTIGLGDERDNNTMGGVFLNLNVGAELDEATLKKVANTTGGRYFRATNLKSLEEIYSTINKLEKIDDDKETVRPKHDYYPYPLACALILFLYLLLKIGLFNGVNLYKRGL